MVFPPSQFKFIPSCYSHDSVYMCVSICLYLCAYIWSIGFLNLDGFQNLMNGVVLICLSTLNDNRLPCLARPCKKVFDVGKFLRMGNSD